MPDNSEKILPKLKIQALPGLQTIESWQLPCYQGYSLLNIPSSICQLLGASPIGAGPLATDILDRIGGPYQRVIFLVLDGLGFLAFKNYLHQGLGKVWSTALESGFLTPITSVVPSTTTSALTTLWTGSSPAEHGIVGYELWLKEFGVVTNMILHAPMSFSGDTGGLKRAGFQPETFLPVPTLGDHLHRNSIPSHAFMHQAIAHSGLSMMHFPRVKPHAYINPVDLSISMARLLEDQAGQPMYVYAYWGDLDELSHRYGPKDERVAFEFDAFSRIFESCFLDRLSPLGRRDTLLLMAADHGLIDTPKNPRYDLRFHPQLMEALHLRPTGENRMVYFYIRPGYESQVSDYLERTWPSEFILMGANEFLRTGLLGPGKYSQRVVERIGDMVAIPRKDAYLWWADKENPLLGRHGGLTSEEMLVPFFALSL